MSVSASNESKSSLLNLDGCCESRMPKGDLTWHNHIIFYFFYSEYWHSRLVLSLGLKAEVHGLGGRVDMRLTNIFCVFSFTAIFPVCFTEISNLSNCHQTQCLSGVEGTLNFEKYIRKSGCHIGVQTNFGEK